jgi:very-short-patch-repair endonuclease
VVDAEAVLWNKLKSKNLDGRKFRRQHSIGKYIVDFYCPSEKLIIELDGDPHGDPVQVWKDTIRDKYLEELGFTVLNHPGRESKL